MDKNTIDVLKAAVESMDKKEFSIHFFVMDTQGNPVAGVANMYEHVKILRELGYNAGILHEKNNYTPVNWLGEEYTQFPHVSAESAELKVSPQDIVIVPEIYANVLEQLSKLPGYRVVLCQSYDYILDILPPGKSWRDYGVTKCITTTETQKEYIDKLFSNTIDVSVVPVGIPDYFKPTEKDKKPIVSVVTRDQRDLVKLFKSFYLRHPHLKWITFRDMRGLPRDVFAKDLSESCLAVWVDDIAGFGTFPLEAMKSDVPVIGKVPNIIPEYFSDKNGLWTHDATQIPDLVANYVQAWLEDSEPADLYSEMGKSKDTYTMNQMSEKVKEVYEKIFSDRKEELINSIPKETELEGEVIELGDDNKETETVS
jgi:glycosyltransferase involved in cell wall biosynthesis